MKLSQTITVHSEIASKAYKLWQCLQRDRLSKRVLLAWGGPVASRATQPLTRWFIKYHRTLGEMSGST